ncbi:TPA: Hok/Gef family protein [Escherichia coli]|nr:Hok/Gef family protein [Escherichia coli]EES9330819.1 Hok/Gef family protein [Escherichia coli]EFH2229201.1 Hok/Gef family protein [Escherichia coli]EFH6873188.1 Hok/Gef family protein [Escherichia coli]EFN7330943.1 Hok/Gef family protein [Escherichia coli]
MATTANPRPCESNTILTFTLLTRQTLYELRFRDGDKEVAALMACTSR